MNERQYYAMLWRVRLAWVTGSVVFLYTLAWLTN